MASSKFREPVDEVFGKCCLVLSLAKATWHGEVGGRGLGSLGDFSVCVCVWWPYILIICQHYLNGHASYNSNIYKDLHLLSAGLMPGTRVAPPSHTHSLYH